MSNFTLRTAIGMTGGHNRSIHHNQLDDVLLARQWHVRHYLSDLGELEHVMAQIYIGAPVICREDVRFLIAAILAMRSGRPVKQVEEKQEHFTSTIHGRGEVQYIDAAYTNDGVLLGLRLRYYTDLGA